MTYSTLVFSIVLTHKTTLYEVLHITEKVIIIEATFKESKIISNKNDNV